MKKLLNLISLIFLSYNSAHSQIVNDDLFLFISTVQDSGIYIYNYKIRLPANTKPLSPYVKKVRNGDSIYYLRYYSIEKSGIDSSSKIILIVDNHEIPIDIYNASKMHDYSSLEVCYKHSEINIVNYFQFPDLHLNSCKNEEKNNIITWNELPLNSGYFESLLYFINYCNE